VVMDKFTVDTVSICPSKVHRLISSEATQPTIEIVRARIVSAACHAVIIVSNLHHSIFSQPSSLLEMPIYLPRLSTRGSHNEYMLSETCLMALEVIEERYE